MAVCVVHYINESEKEMKTKKNKTTYIAARTLKLHTPSGEMTIAEGEEIVYDRTHERGLVSDHFYGYGQNHLYAWDEVRPAIAMAYKVVRNDYDGRYAYSAKTVKTFATRESAERYVALATDLLAECWDAEIDLEIVEEKVNS